MGRDLEVVHEIGEPYRLEVTAAGYVLLHCGEVPSVDAVEVGEGLDTSQHVICNQAVERGEEPQDDSVRRVHCFHRHRRLLVRNSFPAERRQHGILHQLYMSSFDFDLCFSLGLSSEKCFIICL